ncbi:MULTISPECIES: class I SAM-dependent RNA methyltransferase [Trueperella]|uniref:tRNA/tmRNA/rRNA uracil-C5-methylase (TrmA/RlmC/RlmD family) n=1 Tax=Trueperella abortisuis TaxID=445930 RepID=A0ABT9PHY1_9ACTO|nr:MULTISPECIES: TRAM domain-containing protein [Trueperella]MDP9832309.1 tRNA/tmRNA/rRNA uracil-C5-methylase (TrmA/RlmC/RlmD family) [Trueperella abortisuis]MDY5403983.1 TRAM domain-containing protein [Trueperella sp.]
MILDITDIGHGGVGIARHEGRVVFVRGAIPGERVKAELTSSRSRYATAVVREVVQASPERVTHPWPEGAAGVTGAADFGHITLAGQRSLKERALLGNLRRIGGQELLETALGLGLSVAAVDDTDGWGSRTRFDVVKLERGVGMYREGTKELVPITSMPLALPELERLIFDPAWDREIAPGTRVHVVGPASGEDVVVADRVYTAPGRKGESHIWERATTERDVFDYRVSASGFWQVHARAPHTLLRAVMKAAGVQPGESVLELFSGAGLFTVPLAKAVGPTGRLRAIEGSQRAVADAKANLAGMPWASVRMARIDERTVREVSADVVVADPPRAGLGRKTAGALAKSPARIVLVSCDPAAMARDVAELVAGGRTVESMAAFDIFPHTHHVETVVSIQGQPAKA